MHDVGLQKGGRPRLALLMTSRVGGGLIQACSS